MEVVAVAISAPDVSGPPAPSDDGWERLEKNWAAVRARITALRALADELEVHADEWGAIIAERSSRLD